MKVTLKLVALFILICTFYACKHEYTCDCTIYEFEEETDEVETIYIEDTRNHSNAKCAALTKIEKDDTTGFETYAYRCELR